MTRRVFNECWCCIQSDKQFVHLLLLLRFESLHFCSASWVWSHGFGNSCDGHERRICGYVTRNLLNKIALYAPLSCTSLLSNTAGIKKQTFFLLQVEHSVTLIYIDKCWLSSGVRGGIIPIYNSLETATLAINLTEDDGTLKITYLYFSSP